jgi:hypothetical protein
MRSQTRKSCVSGNGVTLQARACLILINVLIGAIASTGVIAAQPTPNLVDAISDAAADAALLQVFVTTSNCAPRVRTFANIDADLRSSEEVLRAAASAASNSLAERRQLLVAISAEARKAVELELGPAPSSSLCGFKHATYRGNLNKSSKLLSEQLSKLGLRNQ